jgi:MinD-like ATPase involved in chromosome partitioning or flagellar assembly
MPALTLTRGARRLRFLQDGRALLTLRGDIRHKDLWTVDVSTGQGKQLTHLPADFNIRDFDVSADGREILLERIEDHSDIVLIDLPR